MPGQKSRIGDVWDYIDLLWRLIFDTHLRASSTVSCYFSVLACDIYSVGD